MNEARLTRTKSGCKGKFGIALNTCKTRFKTFLLVLPRHFTSPGISRWRPFCCLNRLCLFKVHDSLLAPSSVAPASFDPGGYVQFVFNMSSPPGWVEHQRNILSSINTVIPVLEDSFQQIWSLLSPRPVYYSPDPISNKIRNPNHPPFSLISCHTIFSHM